MLCFESILQPLKPLSEKGFSFASAILPWLTFNVCLYIDSLCFQMILPMKMARQCSEFNTVRLYDSWSITYRMVYLFLMIIQNYWLMLFFFSPLKNFCHFQGSLWLKGFTYFTIKDVCYSWRAKKVIFASVCYPSFRVNQSHHLVLT